VIVLDAFAIVEWLLRTSAGLRVEVRIIARPAEIHAPHLVDVEVLEAIRRYVALAESLRAPLVTCDRRLAGARGHNARVEVI
jgi:predicted nucleic acid-binding protein